MYGRKQILTRTTSLSSENVIAELYKALSVHEQNALEIQKLYDYFVGKHPILERQKNVRPEICNKIVENHAYEITSFKTGFTFGEPVQYVYRGGSVIENNNGDDNAVAALNEAMEYADKSTKDRELAEWFYICGVAYRIVLLNPETKRVETYVCDPRSTFVVYSADYKREPVFAVVYSVDDTIQGKDHNVYTVYGKEYCWVIKDNKIESVTPYYGGILPVIEYRHNPTRQGCFENVLGLIDYLDMMASNRADGIEQIIQSLIWFNNCEIDEEKFSNLKQQGCVMTVSKGSHEARIQMLENNLDQQQSQTLVDYTYQQMLTIAAVPDRKASAGGNTGQALVIGQGWTMAEAAAKMMEQEFKASEKVFVARVLMLMQSSTKYKNAVDNLTLADIDVKFTRNKTDNLLVKTQGLMNLLESGIHPRIAISHCGLFSDPEQVYIDSEEYISKWAQTTEGQTQTADTFDSDLEKVVAKVKGRQTGGEAE